MATSGHEMEGHDVGVFLLHPSLGAVHHFIREGGNASRYLDCEPERGERIILTFQTLNSARNGKYYWYVVLKQLGTLLSGN